jgi:hypothetical protein
LNFDSSVTVLPLVLPSLDWHRHHRSSPIITTHLPREISPLCQSRSESKLFCLFSMVLSSFAVLRISANFFLLHNFARGLNLSKLFANFYQGGWGGGGDERACQTVLKNQHEISPNRTIPSYFVNYKNI